jgi:hypothetical protein
MNLSEIQICNGALDFVGAGSITSLTDGTVEAAACLRHWPIARQQVFESHPWKCISRQARLTTTTTAPQFGFSYAYPVPADYVRMMGMEDAGDEYQVYQGVLHTDESPGYIDYVYLCTDPTKYTAGLINALQMHLAYRLALALRQDADLAARILTDLEKFFLPVIRHADATGRGVRTMKASTFTDLFS